MGSWNETCMVSNLHIRCRQKIVVLMLTQHRGYASRCYSNAFYDACPLPFYGEYNDYGGAENCHGPMMEKLLSTIKKDLCEMPEGENKYHDRAVSRTNFDIDALFQAERDGRLGIVNLRSPVLFKPEDKETIQEALGTVDQETQDKLDRLYIALAKPDLSKSMIKIQKVFIHGDIFDAIMENYFLEEYKGEGKGTTGYQNCYDHTYFKDVKESIPNFVTEIKALIETIKDDEGLSSLLTGMGHHYIGAMLGKIDVPAAKYLSWFEGHEMPQALINVKAEILNYITANDWVGLAAFTEEVLKVLWLNCYLEHTRKPWTVTTGSGGQNQDHLGYQVLIDAMQKILDDEKADHDEEEEEEDIVAPVQLSDELLRFARAIDKMEKEDRAMLTPETISNTVNLLNKAAVALSTK